MLKLDISGLLIAIQNSIAFFQLSFNERFLPYRRMRNKVESKLKKCKKGGKTTIFLLVDSENFTSESNVEKTAKDLFKATKNMKGVYPIILVGGSSATDQMEMDRAVRILRRRTKLDIILVYKNKIVKQSSKIRSDKS